MGLLCFWSNYESLLSSSFSSLEVFSFGKLFYRFFPKNILLTRSPIKLKKKKKLKKKIEKVCTKNPSQIELTFSTSTTKRGNLISSRLSTPFHSLQWPFSLYCYVLAGWLAFTTSSPFRLDYFWQRIKGHFYEITFLLSQLALTNTITQQSNLIIVKETP